MSRNARVEELSDSDPEEIAPSDSSFSDNVIIEPAAAPTAPRQANNLPPRPAQTQPMNQVPEPTREIPKHYQCLYPIYFDKTRSRAEGRKVGSELAVENPLARDIVDAVQMLGLQAGLEPEKLHPKDWANPGRVRVLLKNEDGKSMNSKIKNSTFPSSPPETLISGRLFDKLTICDFRAPSLYTRRSISSGPSDQREVPVPITDSRPPHAGEAARCAPCPSWLENWQDPPHSLARLQRRRRQ